MNVALLTDNALGITYRVQPPLDNTTLNALFVASWPGHQPWDFSRTLAVCLSYVGAFTLEGDLIGFIKLAWDGEVHGFLLDPTVHPTWRKKGIGTELVRFAVEIARRNGLEWVHVDYLPEVERFYAGCGFVPTSAGLINLSIVTR
jgi:GNAT superfamily N-acetyltransferase